MTNDKMCKEAMERVGELPPEQLSIKGFLIPVTAIDPAHYRSHPSGVECVQITEHMGFLLGNAVKYIWRADLKDNAVEDLKKARWYIDREISKRTQYARN